MDPASKTMVADDLPRTGKIDSGKCGWKGPKVGEILPPDVFRYRSASPRFPPQLIRLGFGNMLTEDMVSAIEYRKVFLCVYVLIDYEDAFGIRHDSVEPFFYDPDIGGFRSAYSGFHQSD
jgi:hypothetical protein